MHDQRDGLNNLILTFLAFFRAVRGILKTRLISQMGSLLTVKKYF